MSTEARGHVEGVFLDGADDSASWTVHVHINSLGEEQEGSGHLAANRVNDSGVLGRTCATRMEQGWTCATPMAAKPDL